ncbi:putative periplasmic protein [Rhizobium leguminosarum bv. trifolii WSM2297]|uniref:Putative periplasmic protein n=1 Tax=Rhizobium leguminosarum bv. trifolii WSM2297 TaxID=754762 RepID=J0C7L8_RHILT|nr:SH3 domain-containing protein [Rhizobium leguminosarum]EJC78982.1 putative periplasmic protein [Rhizobium leguminosarum bv. trifolii WSM2297]
MFSSKLLIFGLVVCAWLGADEAEARLGYTLQKTDTGSAFVIVAGTFEYSDDLAGFREVVARDRPVVVSFDSPGGNVTKAMELGRLVRSLGLSTLQVRAAECASACSLAFLGGVHRFAQPGSIGVHKSSFSDTEGMPVNDAVSAVQQITAEVIGYMSEMGVDPGLLQLSLSYDSDDIRYLSGSEMTKYKVTTPTLPPLLSTEVEPEPSRDIKTPDGVQAKAEKSLQVPLARSGSVRHPKGRAPIKASENPDSKTIGEAQNGSSVQILDIDGDWYRVTVSGNTGYMHYSWVHVAEFEEDAGDRRYVQVKSFSSLSEAEAFVKQSPVPLAAHLAANGWFAVTLRDVYAEQEAKDVSNALKAHGLIAKDAMITLGNTYVRQLCCK